jgi:hypothetical protein
MHRRSPHPAEHAPRSQPSMRRCSPPWSGSHPAPPCMAGARAHPAPWLELEPASRRHGRRAKLAPRIRPPCPAPHYPAPAGHHFHKLARARRHLLEHPRLPVAPTRWRRMASMWVELVPSNGGDHSNPHLRVYFLLDLTQTHTDHQSNASPFGSNLGYPSPTLKPNTW